MGCGGSTFCCEGKALRIIISGSTGFIKRKGLTCVANGPGGISRLLTGSNVPISTAYSSVGAWIL
jgi:hypothetical protein